MAKFRSTDMARLASLAQRAALTINGLLAALAILAAFTRANNRGNKAAVDQPPWLELFYEKSDSNERLRVSNWIVQRLYHYAIKKTVEF